MSEMIATRDGFGDEILELGRENKNIYVIDVDLGKSCKTQEFLKQFPKQHINVGIAEQNAAGIAAGLATCGKIPFVATFAIFESLRMLEMIRQEVCYPNLNVNFIGSHGGFTSASDGASHQSIEDMGVLRCLPNMTIIMPSDYWGTRRLVRAAADLNGPVFIRLTREKVDVIYDENTRFEIGKSIQLREGSDAAIIANGDTVRLALKAADELTKQGFSVRLIDMHTVKPLDIDAVVKSVDDIGKIVTVEDHTIINGLGSAVCEVVAEMGRGKVKRIGVPDKFGESATYERLLEKSGITVENICEQVKRLNVK